MKSINEQDFLQVVIKNCELLFFVDHQDIAFNAAPRKKEIEILSETGLKASKDDIIEKAKDVINRDKLVKILCPYLKGASTDLAELAKIALTILLPLSISKAISVP